MQSFITWLSFRQWVRTSLLVVLLMSQSGALATADDIKVNSVPKLKNTLIKVHSAYQKTTVENVQLKQQLNDLVSELRKKDSELKAVKQTAERQQAIIETARQTPKASVGLEELQQRYNASRALNDKLSQELDSLKRAGVTQAALSKQTKQLSSLTAENAALKKQVDVLVRAKKAAPNTKALLQEQAAQYEQQLAQLLEEKSNLANQIQVLEQQTESNAEKASERTRLEQQLASTQQSVQVSDQRLQKQTQQLSQLNEEKTALTQQIQTLQQRLNNQSSQAASIAALEQQLGESQAAAKQTEQGLRQQVSQLTEQLASKSSPSSSAETSLFEQRVTTLQSNLESALSTIEQQNASTERLKSEIVQLRQERETDTHTTEQLAAQKEAMERLQQQLLERDESFALTDKALQAARTDLQTLTATNQQLTNQLEQQEGQLQQKVALQDRLIRERDAQLQQLTQQLSQPVPVDEKNQKALEQALEREERLKKEVQALQTRLASQQTRSVDTTPLTKAPANGLLAAFEAEQAGDIPKAYQVASAVVAEGGDAESRLMAARLAISMGRSAEEVNAYLQPLLDREPTVAEEARVLLGRFALIENRLGDAERFYQSSLPLDQLSNYATLLKRQGNFERSEAILKTIITLKPDDPALHYNLGNLYTASNQFKKAKVAFSDAIKQDATLSKAFYNLALVEIQLKEPTEAKKHLQTYLQLEPNADNAAAVKEALAQL